MTIKKIVEIELKKINLKKYIQQVLIANVGIILLVFLTSFLPALSNGEVPQIPVVTVIDSLVKSVFIVWESVLIANLIIEEFSSKTVLLLFSYPLDRKKVIVSKLLIISTMIFASMVFSQLLQNILFLGIDQFFPIVHYHNDFLGVGLTILTTVTSILLGMLPMYVGMLNKSTVATVVSSILIVSLTVSSGGPNGGNLITMVPVSLTMGVVGILMAFTAIKKMLSEDIAL